MSSTRLAAENNNNNNNGDGNGDNNGDSDNNMVPPEEHVFTSQLDSFEMDEIALQVRSRQNFPRDI